MDTVRMDTVRMAMEISVIIVHTGLLPLKDLGLTALFVQLPVLLSSSVPDSVYVGTIANSHLNY